MVLTKGQEQGLKVAVERYKNHEPYTVIAGYAGTGKAQPVDTIVPTPSGHKLLGDIQVGDYVFDRHGNPTKVLGVYPQGLLDCYKVELSDGRVTYCNDEHLWSYYTSKGNLATKTLKEMLERGVDRYSKSSHYYAYPIPVAKAIEYSEKNYEIDPYVVGAFLGNGCCLERQLTISSNDEENVAEVARLIKAKKYCKNSDKNYNWTFDLQEPISRFGNRQITKFQTDMFFKNVPELIGGSAHKRIPKQYFYGSIKQRIDLVQGLMDTDGYICGCDGGRYNISYTSVNYNLIRDIQELLLSLGYVSRIHKEKRTDKYTTNACYALHINIPNSEKYKLFRLTRKKKIAEQAMNVKKHRDYNKTYIVNVEKMPYQKEMVCIYVDNPEHLYLTNDYIVTHNTTLVNYIIDELNINQNDVCYIAYTGRAALILQEKGCENAMTAHRLLYYSKEKPDGTFEHKPRKTLEHDYKLIVVDEVSMLPDDMWKLLLSHHVYVIALGDPFQLPPIDGESEILAHPHVFLDEIVRQAQDSEIIRLSMDIRAGKPLVQHKGDEVSVVTSRQLNDAYYAGADQIIAAKNITRTDINWRCRKIKYGADVPDYPINGDKSICLKNYWNSLTNLGDPAINGLIGRLNNVTFSHNVYKYGDIMYADFVIGENNRFNGLFMDYKLFMEGKQTVNSDNWTKFKGLAKPMLFDYGYCITCHKAEGGEWDKVLVFDEYMKGTDHARWLYTAATRSKKKLIIVSDY